MNYGAVLFDFDGVIAHTMPVMKQVLWRFFWEKNIDIDQEEYAREDWWTKSLEQVCDILKLNHGLTLDVHELRKSIWEGQKTLFAQGLESDPTLIPYLKYCKNKDIKIAIGSNSTCERIQWVLQLMKIDGYFSTIIWSNDLTHHKPDPEVWIKCSEMLEAPITECLVIEDGLPGLTGAKACSAHWIYYHWFCRPEKACQEIAEKSVGSFSELFSD
jgi:beta-phosphoglucomutase